MCKKQTSASHSSTESEIISLDAGLRMDGIPALDLWDLVFEVLQSSLNQPVQGNLLRDKDQRKHTNITTKKHPNRDDLELFNVDHVTTNEKPSHFVASRYIFEDSEAVIKMIIKGQKSYDETRVPNPQSCSWLVVW